MGLIKYLLLIGVMGLIMTLFFLGGIDVLINLQISMFLAEKAFPIAESIALAVNKVGASPEGSKVIITLPSKKCTVHLWENHVKVKVKKGAPFEAFFLHSVDVSPGKKIECSITEEKKIEVKRSDGKITIDKSTP